MRVGQINTKDWGYEENDFERGKKLGRAKQGSGHDNFLSGIIVQYDVKYSQYWSMEFQRYHFNQIISSTSKMHRLTSVESLSEFEGMFNKYVSKNHIGIIYRMIQSYKETPSYELFMEILSNLPMGYELWMTVSTNYLQLKTMYYQRKNHKLAEDWGAFCKWCESLPKFMELIGANKETQ